MTFGEQKCIIKIQSREGNLGEYGGRCQKGKNMEEEMNLGEILVEKAEENQTRKILEILNECEGLEEAKEKVKALLK